MFHRTYLLLLLASCQLIKELVMFLFSETVCFFEHVRMSASCKFPVMLPKGERNLDDNVTNWKEISENIATKKFLKNIAT